MRKRFAGILAVCMAAALCACSGQPAGTAGQNTGTAAKADTAAAAQEAATAKTAAAAQIANPVREYSSLTEINEIAGGKITAPADAEVTDERYSIIDTGDYKIAQYEFTLDGVEYCCRFANGIVEDISGIYVGEGTLFADNTDNGEEIREFDGGMAARHFNLDGQYILMAKDNGKLDKEAFEKTAEQVFEAAYVANGDDETMIDLVEGSWHEAIAGRAVMEITADGDKAQFKVNWPNSASEVYIWEFTGTLAKDGGIEYSNGKKYSLVFDENGSEEKTDLSENNSGTISFNEDGNLLWIDNESENPEGTVFVRDDQ